MAYKEALEAAGAEVLVFEEFGSYQGNWYAKVNYNGNTGWVTGCYGSCPGCDAFENEFGWGDDHKRADYQERLASFGRDYLDDILTQEQAEKRAAKNISWDMDAEEMLAFIKSNT